LFRNAGSTTRWQSGRAVWLDSIDASSPTREQKLLLRSTTLEEATWLRALPAADTPLKPQEKR